MNNDNIFDAWINPIAFLEVDEPWAGNSNEIPSYEAILQYLCAPHIESDRTSLITRYKEISKEPKRLFAAPAEERILTKLIWPLRYAKSSYMIGNYLGTIAICGMVAEMVAILLFDISNIQINGKLVDKKDEIGLFGSQFEKLGQDRRISVLYTYNIIDKELKSQFEIIKNKRRRYLHLYSQDHTELASDAIEVFSATMIIVVDVIGQDLQSGKIILKPKMLEYLKKKGIAKPRKPNNTNDTV